eukprot:scaffold25502_cov129-Isochrysis_galbana.AAC.7
MEYRAWGPRVGCGLDRTRAGAGWWGHGRMGVERGRSVIAYSKKNLVQMQTLDLVAIQDWTTRWLPGRARSRRGRVQAPPRHVARGARGKPAQWLARVASAVASCV